MLGELLLDEAYDVQSCAGCGQSIVPIEDIGAYWSADAGGWVHDIECDAKEEEEVMTSFTIEDRKSCGTVAWMARQHGFTIRVLSEDDIFAVVLVRDGQDVAAIETVDGSDTVELVVWNEEGTPFSEYLDAPLLGANSMSQEA